MRAVAALPLGLAVMACGALMSDTDQRLCAVGQKLSAAITVVHEAMIEKQSGNPAGAATLTEAGRAEAEDAEALLESMSADDLETSRAFERLVSASSMTLQATTLMMPEFSDTLGVALDLAGAIGALAKADASLPVACLIAAPPPMPDFPERRSQ